MTMVVDADTIKAFVIAIVRQAISDWEALDRGKRKAVKNRGEIIRRRELILFFNSQAFDGMCEYAFQTRANGVRDALDIPTEMIRDEPYEP